MYVYCLIACSLAYKLSRFSFLYRGTHALLRLVIPQGMDGMHVSGDQALRRRARRRGRQEIQVKYFHGRRAVQSAGHITPGEGDRDIDLRIGAESGRHCGRVKQAQR